MIRFVQYYGRFQDVKGQVTGLPAWGKLLVFLAAVPGLVLLALSVLVFGVSLLALLLLTVPVYRLASFVSGAIPKRRETVIGEEVDVIDSHVVETVAPPQGPRRHVEVKIIES